MSMSIAYGEPDPIESEATLRRALELGITFLDTANAYGSGHNEEFVGRILGGRDDVVLATKFGIVNRKDRRIDGRPEQVAERCEESLGRLGRETIDLYYLHRVDPLVPVEETVGAMAELVKSGKVRHLGLSEVNSATLRRAHAVHPITAVQSEYSLWTRDPENGLLDACRELGVGFVPFSPLGRGMLTGAIHGNSSFGEKDLRRKMPRFQAEHFETNRNLVTRLGEIAEARGCRPGQLAIAWVLAQGDFIAPIPGTKRVATLEENAAAAEISLSAAESTELDQLFAKGRVSGPRYPEAMMKTIQREGD